MNPDGTITQSDPSSLNNVTVYSSLPAPGFGDGGGYYSDAPSAIAAAGSGGSAVPITFTKKGCMSSGDSAANLARTLPIYSMTGDTNSAAGVFGTHVAIDNDGDPTVSHSVDPDKRMDTTYNMGTSSSPNYLNSGTIAYVALSRADAAKMGLQLGDLVLLVNPSTGTKVWAMWGDVGNTGEAGEISYYAATQLGLSGVTRNSGGSGTINMIGFPGTALRQSGTNQPFTQTDLDVTGGAIVANNPSLPYNGLPSGVSKKC